MTNSKGYKRNELKCHWPVVSHYGGMHFKIRYFNNENEINHYHYLFLYEHAFSVYNLDLTLNPVPCRVKLEQQEFQEWN